MKEILKAIAATLAMICIFVYLLIGIFPFQKQMVWLLSKNHMNKTYPDFELQEIKVYYDWKGNGYDITCYSAGGEKWELSWATYPPFSWGVSDISRDNHITMHTFKYNEGINEKIKSLISKNFSDFSSSAGATGFTREELTYMYDNQIEVKDKPISWSAFFISSEDEFWTIEQFAEKVWDSIDTLTQNDIEFFNIEIRYNRENNRSADGQLSNPIYRFYWDNTMGELTKDTILPLIKEVNQ